jgi:CRP-like cAMP-binding protein
VIRQGEPAEAVFIVLEGEAAAAAVRETNPVPTIPFRPGEVFGEVAVFLEEPYRLTVTASAPLVVLRVERHAFVELVRQIPDLAVAVIRDLAWRLTQLRERYERVVAPPESCP